jgi:small subunit ribosomal protein S7
MAQKHKFKVFGIYDCEEVKVKDIGLQPYICLSPLATLHTHGRLRQRFGKAKMHIVERLINNMMRTEHTTGEKFKTYNIVRLAFAEIAKKSKKNPVQVLVEALENAAPREEVTRLIYGGVPVPKSIDTAPQRRLDIALRNICIGAVKKSHKNKTRIHVCLAQELLAAANNDSSSFAIAKKDEVERIAASAR